MIRDQVRVGLLGPALHRIMTVTMILVLTTTNGGNKNDERATTKRRKGIETRQGERTTAVFMIKRRKVARQFRPKSPRPANGGIVAVTVAFAGATIVAAMAIVRLTVVIIVAWATKTDERHNHHKHQAPQQCNSPYESRSYYNNFLIWEISCSPCC
jgi:hypothetical protein